MEKLKKIYVDRPAFFSPISVDDFIVTVGVKQSNSVYHIAAVNPKPRPDKRMIRYYLQVYDSDLPTALKRDSNQQLITVTWYKR